jgi:hypothetical protein
MHLLRGPLYPEKEWRKGAITRIQSQEDLGGEGRLTAVTCRGIQQPSQPEGWKPGEYTDLTLLLVSE